MEKRYIRKDGSRVWIDLNVSLMRRPSGEPECFIAAIMDVTPRKLKELVPDPLKPQEMEVLRLIAHRRINREIADELRYSQSAVKYHVRNILAKLRVPNRAQAADRAVEIGLLPPPR